jgi:hypothetical protein
MLASTPAYELKLEDNGTEPSDRHCPISSHCIGRCGLRLLSEGGVRPLGAVTCLRTDLFCLVSKLSLVIWRSHVVTCIVL